MTTLTRFVPFRSPLADVALLQNRLNSIFNDFARPEGETASESLAKGSFVPAVDVYEDQQALTLKLEVPGIRQEDLDVRLEYQTLTSRASARSRRTRRKRTSTGLSGATAASAAALPCRRRSTPPRPRRATMRVC